MVDSGRICSRCATWKSAECYYRRRDKPGRLVAICKECTSRAGRRPHREPRTCLACKREFQPKPTGRLGSYCSQLCGATVRRLKASDGRPPRAILVVDDNKRCNKCLEWKPVSQFGVRKDRNATPLSECRQCTADRAREYSRSDRGRNVRYAYKYGVSLEWYESRLAEQSNRCAICDQAADPTDPNNPRLVIDHCHRTGAARGLLCFKCNLALGRFEHDPDRLLRAHAYLTLST